MGRLSPLQQNGLTCSIIGSFRKYYEDVRRLIAQIESVDVVVLSPKHSSIVNPGSWFVVLETDPPELTPAEIQLIALHRILRSDFVYALIPRGYVGRTTAYEMGGIQERCI